MSKGNTFENDFLKLIFHGTPIANLADNAASAPATNLYLGLHTADVGEGGNETANECAYAGYARVAIARSSSGFTIVNNTVTLAAAALFPEAPAGADETATHWHVGTSASGAGKVLYKGAIDPTIVITEGVQPKLGTNTTITED